ncbi:hypothetical protein ACIRUY_17110 [Streptomyces erythrochromogenes]|uniref:hypothetical protein n=1 Tax=Streptomyces erythrochromogenes TaxID=285574 RepID=UPI0037FC263F
MADLGLAREEDEQMTTYADPGAGRHSASISEIRDWAKAWDTYDPEVHGSQVMPGFYTAARHENWWGSTVSLEQLLDLAQVHGIPVAWVPDRDVLRQLAAAGPTHDEKLAVLVGAEEEIRALCHARLDECHDEWLTAEIAAGHKALAAWDDGHREAAATLAIAALEQILYTLTEAEDRSHGALRQIGRQKPNSYLPARQYVFAPLATLFARYYPERNDPLPDNLSRHAVLHHLPLDHLSRGHCTVAIMLLVSVLRQSQERAQDIRDDLMMAAAD